MKCKQNKRSARVSSKKIKINKGAKGLTAQAGLIPVVKFLQKHNVDHLIRETSEHRRGAAATYDAVDIILLPLPAVIGGARSVSDIATVRADSVLCRIAGWRLIPDETTFGRLFRTFTRRHINNPETLTHRLRARMRSKGLRTGKSKVGAACCLTVDADSTEKTAYGSQEGAAKGFTP